VEALDLANADLLKVNIGWVAEDLNEEVLPLLIVEKKDLPSIVIVCSTNIAVLVNPLQKETLVRVKIRLLNKEGPKAIDTFCAQGDSLF
jgi:hypothetical protein